MRVVDHAPQAWFLFQEGESFFLNANCNHGAFGYSFPIELSEEERAQYAARGRTYLDWPARAVHESAPITGKGP